ncbi:hypothetical protein D3OALGA1CA_3175 [Olavius algarvensis associated proteobacterium Delta 3]|nr:hypothetical protein D3OALGA1CA_3175 [Olavius algarvensis associated proteobacterium Delta 3]CAB5164986.1 hypothetical protein D3OALGB2SA_5685 [Olavius algarvensis associated proteobacterium Delta 3]
MFRRSYRLNGRWRYDNHFPDMKTMTHFSNIQILEVNNAVSMAEELVSNYYKMSASQWLRPKFDVKTQAELTPEETVDGPFAQIIRYEGKREDSSLGSSAYDFYKICLQDQAILSILEVQPEIRLAPFVLYIVTHELVHIVRFSRFLQNFDASPDEKMIEEARVHHLTHDILQPERISGMSPVLTFYERWRQPLESFNT